MQCLEQSGKQYSFVYNRFAASDFTLWTEFETTPALTDEPDITIRYDY